MSEAASTTGPYDNGRDGEDVVKKILLHDGWYVVDVNKTSTTAPLLEKIEQRWRLPDIIGFNSRGDVCFFEAKEKDDGPEYIKVHGQNEHCVDMVAYQDYCDIAHNTSIDTYLCVFENDPPSYESLLWQDVTKLDVLETIADNVSKDYGEEQVFFNRGDFEIQRLSVKRYKDVGDLKIEIGSDPLSAAPTPVMDIANCPSLEQKQYSLPEFL